MTNDQAKSLLIGMRLALLSAYPAPPGSTFDNRYAITMGFVLSALVEGLEAVRGNRKIRLRSTHEYIIRKLLKAGEDPEYLMRRESAVARYDAAVAEARACLEE